ncbi:class F sortase [Streptomyces tsukubensis]|uniref:Class F sortase n=1 Tax=Streptomyces tsukubensis TaxID=83656 RepID=A0A1V4AEB7_9ACTN|nr:class F sortase [Streptomyces tsukubensis]
MFLTLSVTCALVTGVVRACDDPRGTPAAATTGRPGVPPLPRATPTEVSLPGIMVEAPVMELAVRRSGDLETPPLSRPKLVGWYGGGPSPGEKGMSVLVGHRDTRTGPAVFLNLNALRPGAFVDVTRSDRRTAVFTVDAVHTYGKKEFPDDKVYGTTGRPELRLLTCGGTFSHKTGYSANVVVFAHLTAVEKA